LHDQAPGRWDDDVMGNRKQAQHERLSGRLASCTEDELAALVDSAQINGVGVGGGSAVIDVEGVPVFVKRIPLTDRELARPRSTANLFGLPVFCQYGMGGPGFNAWRELAANLIVTDAVLAGEAAGFPLLHHWRVLPGRAPVAAEHADIDAAVAAMADDQAVRVRLEALAAASHSLVLFCEYIPHPMAEWLRDDPAGKAETLERQMMAAVAFLRQHELLHMDGHFGNMRVDGERIYLTDFGLVTSSRFELSAAEQNFVRRNVGHDAGYAAMSLVNWVVRDVCEIPGSVAARYDYVRQWTGNPGDVPAVAATILDRHAPVAARMNAFYWKLFGGNILAEYVDPFTEASG
jgi:hypothetical protein